VIVVGLFDQPPAFNPLVFIMKEVRIVGSMVYNRKAGRADFDIALELLADRRTQLRSLVTHVVALREAQRAFETAADKKSGAVKVMLDPTA
jgi:threonine dehydrogenase-like Zn-dependent dehydrogenase